MYFSPDAIKKIIDNADTKENLFICTFGRQDTRFIIDPENTAGREPFGYIVVDQNSFRKGIDFLISIKDKFKIKPFSWHLYRLLNGLDLTMDSNDWTVFNNIFEKDGNYLIINDYTRDLDLPEYVPEYEKNLKKWGIT